MSYVTASKEELDRWFIKRAMYECKVHGQHDHPYTFIVGTVKRLYCTFCLIEALDKIGVCEMVEIKDRGTR